MKMICDVPNEAIKSVRMGTWCGSSVAEKMIANGIPLEQIRAEIEKLQTYKMFIGEKTVYVERDDVLAIIDKYKEVRENNADSN